MIRRTTQTGDKKIGQRVFFAKRNLGGNFLNCYHPARAPPQDKLMNKQTELVGSNLLVVNYLVAEPTNVWPAEWSNLI